MLSDTHIHTHTYTHTLAHIHTHTLTYTHIHTHTHTHTQLQEQEVYGFVDTNITLNKTVGNLAESRSNEFTAVFLITLFIVVSLGVALYAISWAMWTMDPGRDSIIYRQVADPTIQ